MSRRSLINLLLLLLVIVLAIIVNFSPDPEPPIGLVPLTPLTPDDIASVRIRKRDGLIIRMELRADGWWMTTPYVTPANSAHIENLLEISSAASLERFPTPAERLAEFDLSPPMASLWLNDLELGFGSIHPYNPYRYIRRGDELHLINDTFPHLVLARPETFVSPRLLPPKRDVRAILTPDWRLTRDSTNRWQLDPPQPDLSADHLIHKVEAWKRGQGIVKTAPREKLDGTVELRLEGEPAPLVFGIRQRPEELLLIRQDLGLAYRLPPDSRLLQPPGDDPDSAVPVD